MMQMDTKEAKNILIRAAERFSPLTDEIVEAIDTLEAREAA